MPTTYTITTEDPNLYQKLFHVSLEGEAPVAVQVAAPAPVAPPPAPVAAPAVPPPPAPAPAPAAPPPPVVAAPAAPAAQHSAAPPGWTIQHVTGALQALGANPAKGGPAAVKAILTEFGVTKVTDLDPGRWPEVHARATAA